MDPNALFQVSQMFIRLLIYTFIGKAPLTVLAGANYRANPVWRLFDAVTRPVWRLTRAITPRLVADAAIGLLSVLLLIILNLGLYMLFHALGWIAPLGPNTPG